MVHEGLLERWWLCEGGEKMQEEAGRGGAAEGGGTFRPPSFESSSFGRRSGSAVPVTHKCQVTSVEWHSRKTSQAWTVVRVCALSVPAATHRPATARTGTAGGL